MKREPLLRSLYAAFNARDHAGAVLFDEEGRHVDAFRGDLVRRMTIER